MASFVYRGTFGDQVVGENGLVTTLRSEAIIGSSNIDRVQFTIAVASDDFHPDCVWRLHWVTVNAEDGSTYFRKKTEEHIVLDKMSSATYTATGELIFEPDDYQFSKNSITLYAKLDCNYPEVSCYLGEVTIEVFYAEVDGARNLLVNDSTYSHGKSAKLTWDALTFDGQVPSLGFGKQWYELRAYKNWPRDSEYRTYAIDGANDYRLNSFIVPNQLLEEWKQWTNRGKVHLRIVSNISTGGFDAPGLGDIKTGYSNCVTFQYRADSTVNWHDGDTWVECVPYYHDGSNWIQCDPYYHDGNDWTLCSNS